MTEHFEAHVTMPWSPEKIAFYKRIADEEGWKVSWIDGDPVLGEKRFFYFTRHETSHMRIFVAMEELVWTLGEGNVLRRKVEKIIFDDKTGIGLCD